MIVGVDLGGTNIAAGLLDGAGMSGVGTSGVGTLRRKASVKTFPERGPEAVVADIAALCRQLLKEEGLPASALERIGIGSPGSVDRQTGTVVFASNLGFRHVPLRAMLQSHWPGVDVYLENDANAAALAEALAGGAKGRSSSVCVTLGTGVGGGIVLDGKLLTGFNGAAGEVGHHIVEAGGLPCTCGSRGCWEVYASASGLIRMTREAVEREPDSRLADIARKRATVDGRTAFDAAKEGDPAGKAVVDRYLLYVALGLVNLINILQPEVICIGGGVAHEGKSLLDALKPLVQERVFQSDQAGTELVLATLGNDAGIIGAALLDR